MMMVVFKLAKPRHLALPPDDRHAATKKFQKEMASPRES